MPGTHVPPQRRPASGVRCRRLLGDPVESRRQEAQRLRIEQYAPKGVSSVAYIYEVRPPMISPGRFSALDQPSWKEIDVDETVTVDDNTKILPIVVLVEWTVGAAQLYNEAR